MKWLIAKTPLIDYEQYRPMRTSRITEQHLSDLFFHKQKISMDCSESVTLLCRLAGLSDPNGMGYNGYGFTGTMLTSLPHYTDPADADVGALVVFGPGTGDHVCMVLTPGSDPLLFSHGQDAGPLAVRFSVEKNAHRNPAVFLSVNAL